MAYDKQTEILRRQLADLEQLTRGFDTVCERVTALVEKASYDPLAARSLQKLEQIWKDGLQQKVEQMEQYMREALRPDVLKVPNAPVEQCGERLNGTPNPVQDSIINGVPSNPKVHIRRKRRHFV